MKNTIIFVRRIFVRVRHTFFLKTLNLGNGYFTAVLRLNDSVLHFIERDRYSRDSQAVLIDGVIDNFINFYDTLKTNNSK